MANLPSGTVTFLFTDIEGSTARWEHYPRAMKPVVERHDAIMRAAIEANEGFVFRTEGDAFRAAFDTALFALHAAVQAQRALETEPWPPEIAPLRVRMALHTGAVELRDTDYVGPSLNRMARLLSTAYGGQTVLSQATEQLVSDNLPAGVALKDMGEHRLKDLIRPEHIYQLAVEGLQSDFPPLKTLDGYPNNLPLQPTPFVGREKEIVALRQLLSRDDTRLITLLGPGGTGKTRLALQLAAEMIDSFLDGVFFVNLAPVRDPSLVVPEIAQTLGIVELGERPLLDSVQYFLRERHLLLILDNFEQVVEAGSIVSQLLQEAPHLKILATSRSVLHLRGEKDFPVPPLELPDPEHLPPPGAGFVPALSQYEAVRLFIERARDAKPDFEVTNETAPAVAEICYRLDGLPLAIELAAARVRILPPQALLARLDSSLKVLTGGARDAPARQQTLRATIEWSYDLLDKEEKQLFGRLALFRGGCTLESVEAICFSENSPEIDPLDGIQSLVDKSLLRQDEGSDWEPRFVMLETVQEFASERLHESGDLEEMQRRHAGFFSAMAETAESELLGPRQIECIHRLETEHGNLRAALSWSLDSTSGSDNTELGIRLAAALYRFWTVRTYYTEGRAWLERALSRTPESTPLRARLLAGLGYLSFFQSDLQAARSALVESVDINQQTMDSKRLAFPLAMLGAVLMSHGESASARTLVDESIQLSRQQNDKWVLASALFVRSLVSNISGTYEEVRADQGESLSLFRQIGDKWGIGLALHGGAMQALTHGDYPASKALFEECLAIYRELGDKYWISSVLTGLGHIAHYQNDNTRAMALFDEAMLVNRELGNKSSIASSLQHMAMVARNEGDYGRATSLLEESLGLLREIGSKGYIATTLKNLGTAAHLQANDARAGELFRESLAISSETGNKPGIAECLAGLALLAQVAAKSERSARLAGAASALFEDIGAHMDPFDRSEFERSLSAVRSSLGEEHFNAAWKEGQAMTAEQAIKYALEDS